MIKKMDKLKANIEIANKIKAKREKLNFKNTKIACW
ncbi:hypothetical protein SDC9_117563 [bioreactor metagenome]|uniref:Uncharacterized protein n=1 Tax=bioreactor metagenome TaxID=1076179 RepID=A0A645BZU0_9ZZZZ